MKKLFVSGLLVTITFFVFGQEIDKIILVNEVERIEKFLSSDDMRGRKVFTPEIDKAADFIADEFEKAGLKTWNDSKTYRQDFALIQPKFISATGKFDDETIDEKNIIVITSQPLLKIDETSSYDKTKISAGAILVREARRLVQENRNLIVYVDLAFTSEFSRLAGLKRGLFKSEHSVVFVLTDKDPTVYNIEAKHEIVEQKLANVVGMIPGRSKKEEYVIFSAHYDHMGVGKPVNGDSIYNGANDDAAGTTAVIMLAKYFSGIKNNERTIVFAAFTAEESGGFGSRYFSQQFDPGKIVAMFNIEMIGTDSKWGKNSAYITGFEKTDMGSIMQKNLQGTGFTFHPDPYPEQNLFYRSDNATLARLGVPAHTISTSKMDSEPNYHKVTDEIGTLDIKNMTMIIKSIALSSRSIISEIDTPTRVKLE